MADNSKDSDLLVPFELATMTGDYGEYYKIKRNNLFATIQKCAGVWELFRRIDEIWKREIDDLEVATRADRVFPLMLYMNAHAKMRLSVELGFSGCLPECRSILRDAVENVAHAHHMLRDPANVKVWLQRDEPNGKKPFHLCFEANKKTNLFKGLDDLYHKYGELSDAGSHPTMKAMHNRMGIETISEGKQWRLHYTGVPDPKTYEMELFGRVLTIFEMERTFYGDYQGRLQFDDQLMRMRHEFKVFKENLRRTLIARYNIKPPAEKPNKP